MSRTRTRRNNMNLSSISRMARRLHFFQWRRMVLKLAGIVLTRYLFWIRVSVGTTLRSSLITVLSTSRISAAPRGLSSKLKIENKSIMYLSFNAEYGYWDGLQSVPSFTNIRSTLFDYHLRARTRPNDRNTQTAQNNRGKEVKQLH